MTKSIQDLKQIEKYYGTTRSFGDSHATIYGIWEQGGACDDSITPSTYSPEYRSHLGLKLKSLTQEGEKIFSIGCGNGFVEGDLVKAKRHVLAIDLNDEAVALSRKKGVDAYTADFFKLKPEALAGVKSIYADGLLGHLFHPELELKPTFDKLKELHLESGTTLIFSNDSPRAPKELFAAHDKVDGFWFISRDYLRDALTEAGFKIEESYYFPYTRPISGLRNRTVCVALVP
ncbi:oxin biosynthesis protein [Gibbsiella quercinecans]|uniref:oxin biosynthesis protein n=1 Tax=Gibbsiella quercinecans TaxID=929813 RepID=UPI000EF26F67|nr:oxin biosynthesis protein [Gibbsiella quercinecans]RLM06691.1 oxin biosynthesis protein [Gibbsiella quercinecans]